MTSIARCIQRHRHRHSVSLNYLSSNDGSPNSSGYAEVPTVNRKKFFCQMPNQRSFIQSAPSGEGRMNLGNLLKSN